MTEFLSLVAIRWLHTKAPLYNKESLHIPTNYMLACQDLQSLDWWQIDASFKAGGNDDSSDR